MIAAVWNTYRLVSSVISITSFSTRFLLSQPMCCNCTPVYFHSGRYSHQTFVWLCPPSCFPRDRARFLQQAATSWVKFSTWDILLKNQIRKLTVSPSMTCTSLKTAAHGVSSSHIFLSMPGKVWTFKFIRYYQKLAFGRFVFLLSLRDAMWVQSWTVSFHTAFVEACLLTRATTAINLPLPCITFWNKNKH